MFVLLNKYVIGGINIGSVKGSRTQRKGKYMLKSKIQINNGIPQLTINGEQVAAMAYTTYFEERNRYRDFTEAGYRIFFVNLYFTKRPFNSAVTGFTAARVGVYDDIDTCDYSGFEDAVREILNICPDAMIFPRIYISMPEWWTNVHQDDVIPTNKGGYREALFSEAFRTDGSELLVQTVRHIKNADYAPRIAGWQICGGQTQEWMHHDLNGSLGKTAEKPYAKWVLERYKEDNAQLPAKEEYLYCGQAFNSSENARRYTIFCNEEVAKTIDVFAGAIKRETGGEQIVGVFYGYTFEHCNTVLFGSHALRMLIDSPSVDFFSSPNAYTMDRALGIDWADMIPVDSVKLHGKLCFIECDIRTYLTKGIQEARPGVYPDDMYRLENGKSVWAGPPTAELSCEAIRKSFVHQLTKASAIWWFDMWGGWYADKMLMKDIAHMREIYSRKNVSNSALLHPEIVLFADETSYANLLSKSPQLTGIYRTRTNMGNIGAPYDICMVEDAEVVLSKYKAVVFPFPIPSEAGKYVLELCIKKGIPYLAATPEHTELTTDEIRTFIKNSGVHIYAEKDDVVYAGNGYLGIHSAIGGDKSLTLPFKCRIKPIFGTDISEQFTDVLNFNFKDNATALFVVEEGVYISEK